MSEEQLIPTPSVFGENGNLIIERELGRGGMGGVYLGRDKMLDRPVAVKAMLREYGNDPEFVEKFKKEAQAAARLIHPNIAQIYSYGIFDGIPYIVMELVAGGSLEQIMKTAGKNTDVPRVMKICEQVAQALRCAADQGLVHGDVKPENILLDANGNAKLVDFGLAGMQKDTDEIWGTPYYIAPEKVKKGAVDYRADMFSLGGTLYHALCGVAPFEGDDATAVVRKRFEIIPTKPSQLREGISPQVDFLVMKMLAVEPADRYPTFEALLEDFKKVLTTGLSTTASLASAAEAVPTVEANPVAKPSLSGKKKLMLKPKKKMVLKKHDEEEIEDADEEEGGNAGVKVLLMIVGIIVIIGLVAGGLIWYQVADKKARAAEIQAQIDSGIKTAQESLSKTKVAALKFADEFDAFAAEAVNDCQKPTDKLTEILSPVYSASVIALLKPPPTQELLDAIASTNIVVEAIAETSTNEVATAEGGTNEVASADAPAAKTRRFRAPVGDEGDPNSPEGEQYLAEKKKWEEAQKANLGDGEAKAEETPKAEAEAKTEGAEENAAPKEEAKVAENSNGLDADGKKTEVPAVVRDLNELWGKAYGCHAAAIRIRKKIIDLVTDIEMAEKTVCNDEESMRKLVEKSNELKLRYDDIKASADVTTVQKAKGFINSRGRKSVDETVRKLREEAAQKARDEAKKARIEAEKQRKAEQVAAREKLAKEEIEKAKECFDKIVNDGKIRQLDWKGAYRVIANLELTTAEGQLELKKQRYKIECMEAMQNIFIKGLKDYTFTRSTKDAKVNLKGATIKSVNEKKIVIQRKGRQSNDEILWQTFYAKYRNSLAEIVTNYIVKNGTQGNETPRLSKLQKFNGTLGTAYILRLVCADDPTAASYAEKLIKEAVKSLPLKFKEVKEFFPDIDFTEVEKEIENENI